MAYLYGECSNDKITMCVEWGYSQDLDANTSRVWAKLIYWKDGIYNTSGYGDFWLSINGNTKEKYSYWMNLQNGTAYEPIEHAVTIPHNADGTLTITISAGGGIGGTSFDSSWLNENITLPQIPRQATITSAPNFNDEENPTITYSNPVGNYAGMTSLQACIASSDGSHVYVPYRNISKTGTSYTFNLTDTERAALRNAIPNSNSMTVRFYVTCVLNGSTLYSSLAKTFSIVNGSPTITNVVAVDTNATTVALTGDNTKAVKYFSNVNVSYSTSAKKGASLKNTQIKNGSTTVNGRSASFQKINNNNFVITVSDSRGNAATHTHTMPMIEYSYLSCSVKAVAPTTEGNGSFTISGNYWNGNFGAQNNTLTLVYRHKVGDGSYSAWQTVSITPTFSNGRYSVKIPTSGLDYRESHTFQAKATDKLMSVESNEHKVRTTPVFDWGENDFRFNVPVRFEASNKVLWDGVYYMLASQTAKLSQPISEQAHGIILVFCGYNGTAATNENWQCFFVPKTLVGLRDGDYHSFSMMSASAAAVCVKHLSISDTQIGGHSSNSSAGTGVIPYNNTAYVLRYVIGV